MKRGVVPQYVQGEVIVKLKTSAHPAVLQKLGMNDIKMLSSQNRLYLLKIPRYVTVLQMIQTLSKNPHIEYAEPNYIYKLENSDEWITQIPNDPDFDKNWGLHNVGQQDAVGQIGTPGVDLDVVKAWELQTGSREIKVSVIDTGVDYNHQDLKDNMFVNSGEVGEYTDLVTGTIKNKENDSVDNDGNGYIDDVRGWNFVMATNDPMDDHSHGTHVAGTIGAVGNNNLGTVGVNWHVTILPAKFLSAGGSGTLDAAVQAIEYSTRMGVHVMSNSWGGGGYSQALADVIEVASKKGILFIAAAGNDGADNDVSSHYPSSYEFDNVISVAASDNRDQKASFSNFGKKNVDVLAPGVKIYSTILNQKYGVMSGTSMAAPHVSGAVALLLAHNPSLTIQEVKDKLFKGSEELFMLRNKIGYGRINVYNALTDFHPPRYSPPDPSSYTNVDYAASTDHLYKPNVEYKYTIRHDGAKFMRVHFSQFETETKYDPVYIRDGRGNVFDILDGKLEPFWSIEVPGDTIEIIFKPDSIVHKYGFDIDQYGYIPERVSEI